MKKMAVLASLVLLFGMGTSALASPEDPPPAPAPVNEVIGNDVVVANGAAANDGGTAVAVKDNLNGNSLFSGNSASSTHTGTATFTKTETEVEDSFNTNNSVDESTNTFGVSKSAFGSASNVGSGSANVEAEYHSPGEVFTDAKNSSVNNSNNKTNSEQHDSNNTNSFNEFEVEADGSGNAATLNGDASVDSRDQSTHTKVEAEAEEGSIAAINTTGNIVYDKSTTITISDIGLALQKNELKGEVEGNVLIVGGPEAKSITVSGKTESGETESGEAESGATLSGAKSKSGSAALAGAKNESGFTLFTDDPKDEESSPSSASASAESSSGSSADSSAAGGDAQSGNAQGGNAQGGNATGAAASATTTFYTGANSFTTGSFNGLGSFNVNSGVSSLQQSPISVNAVVGGSVAGN